MILALKLLLTPGLIAFVTLCGRRWGPGVSGWLMGLPLTSAPVSILLALQYSQAFAAHAAIGTIGGQTAVLVFCLTYSLIARKAAWLVSAVVACLAFLASIFLLNLLVLPLIPTYVLYMFTIAIISRLIRHSDLPAKANPPPFWDLPARMVIAALFVYLLTTFASSMGAQLSGLLSPFPMFGVILAAFTHQQQGQKAASNLLRGIVIGSIGFATFFLIVGGLLSSLGMVWTYLLATCVVLAINGFTLVRFQVLPTDNLG